MAATSQDEKAFRDYKGFVNKFKPKKTTDDCYTPPLVMEAVNRWVQSEYGADPGQFCRPFYPGGDYENEDYTGKIVVDNPPFSMLSKIIDHYIKNDVRFFLFSPTLSGLCSYSDKCAALATGVDITYENGAKICTSFVTNLEPHGIRARTAPALYSAVKRADEETRRQRTKSKPKYAYPPQVMTMARMYQFAQYGIELIIDREQSVRISKLDVQQGKTIFGSGLLLSEQMTYERERAERERAERERAERERAERERAERERAERFELSEREKEIVRRLSGI
jgi:hypothetical protein